MLQDLYTDIDVYREVDRVDEWGNTSKKGNWVMTHQVSGYLQPRSGSFANTNQSNIPLSSHVFYSDIGIDLNNGDRLGSLKYKVNFTQSDGIGGILDHQEIPVDFLNDLS